MPTEYARRAPPRRGPEDPPPPPPPATVNPMVVGGSITRGQIITTAIVAAVTTVAAFITGKMLEASWKRVMDKREADLRALSEPKAQPAPSPGLQPDGSFIAPTPDTFGAGGQPTWGPRRTAPAAAPAPLHYGAANAPQYAPYGPPPPAQNAPPPGWQGPTQQQMEQRIAALEQMVAQQHRPTPHPYGSEETG